MTEKLSRQELDILLMEKARAVAKKILKNGYVVSGVGPGVLFVSDRHPRYPLDMPEALVESLYKSIPFELVDIT